MTDTTQPDALFYADCLDGRASSPWKREDAAAHMRRLHAECESLRKEVHNLNWALGTEGYEQMATPEEQAEADAGHAQAMATIERMKERKTRHEELIPDGADVLDVVESLRTQLAEARESMEFRAERAAQRERRLWQWAHEELGEPLKTRYFNIVANGTADVMEQPIYAQQFNMMKRRAESAEAQLAEAQKLAADRLEQMNADWRRALRWRDEVQALRSLVTRAIGGWTTANADIAPTPAVILMDGLREIDAAIAAKGE